MTTATLPIVWTGRTGRRYAPVEGSRVRRGGMASVRKVLAKGAPVRSSVLPQGAPLALKLWNEGDEASLDQLQREANVLRSISQRAGELPCPRLYDELGDPMVTGLLMEWCPADLGRWWAERLEEPDAFGRLMATMAEVSRRVSDYHVFFAAQHELAAHGDIKPSNILLATDGRWLVSDFGTALIAEAEDAVWDDTQKVVATENFLAPEVLFNAKKRHPAAIDTWSIGASVFALLRLRRMVIDRIDIPRNRTHSPRFRTERQSQVQRVYAENPRRFRGMDLEADAFHSPLRLPDEDRRAVRDAMQGILPSEAAEDELTDALLFVLDRAMSIDPAHRYTSCRDLAAAFESLTRVYIQLSATGMGTPSTGTSHDTSAPLAHTTLHEQQRLDRLTHENQRLQDQIDQLNASADTLPSERPDVARWLLVGVVFVQGIALLAMLVLIALLALR